MREVFPGDVFQRDPDVVNRLIAGERILIPIRGQLAQMQRIFALNPTGQFVWEHLDGKRSVAELARLVSEQFGIEPARALEDVNGFLGDAVGQGIVL